MKYWRGYLVAAIFAVITWALLKYAEAHCILIDMIYPYMTRKVINSLVTWSAGFPFCLWQVLLLGLGAIAGFTVVLMIALKWNVFQWFGWILAAISCVAMLNTALFGLNKYASPLADDIRLEINDYTVSELNEAALHFRDRANALAQQIPRDASGNPKFGTFEELAAKAGDGYKVLTYDRAMSVFAGSTEPVKKLSPSPLIDKKMGLTVVLTGEAGVNPEIPTVVLPFAMCNEMAHRMTIYSDADAAFAAFLAGSANPSVEFQYSAYMMAYNYCYTALKNIPTSTAKTCAAQMDKGVNQHLRRDLKSYTDFFGEAVAKNDRAPIPASVKDEKSPITFSEYTTAADLFVNWYIQTYIVPQHVVVEEPFDPLDPTQVDLTGLVNAKK